MKTTRRHLLRGLSLGAAGALLSPFLKGVIGEAVGQSMPKSFFFLGGWMSYATQFLKPTARSSTDFDLNPSMEALKPYQADLNLVTDLYSGGLAFNGGHGIMPADFFSGLKSPSWEEAQGPTFDRYLAAKIGQDSRFSSLHFNLTEGLFDGVSAPPISGIQSWDAAKQPYPPLRDPMEAYQKIFGAAVPMPDPVNTELLLAQDRSLLDFVVKDVQSVRSRLAAPEAEKLDLYTESLRSIERKLSPQAYPAACTGMSPPPATNMEFSGEIARAEVLLDLAATALACGATRVVSYWLNLCHYGGIGFGDDNIHDTVYHALSPDEFKIQQWRMQQLARSVELTRQFGRGDSTLIAYADPNGDVHHGGQDGQFFILIGKLGGALKAGQAIAFPKNTRTINDMWITIANSLGVETPTFGNPDFCKGALSELV